MGKFTHLFDGILPLSAYRIGDMIYALWPGKPLTTSKYDYVLDVLNVKKRRWFWFRRYPKIIAIFKIKLKKP